jgi:hypothetical protein
VASFPGPRISSARRPGDGADAGGAETTPEARPYYRQTPRNGAEEAVFATSQRLGAACARVLMLVMGDGSDGVTVLFYSYPFTHYALLL